ncbi:DUF6115 domain-containing protein [Virgibacillus senegalensis]|uniref:DUF6115 domain-containing protein n=1 Tax=Virgibacillus senegalensis TaxID=1499679 RepID=UPI00069DCA22|nr:hypothetical protein [Virgibacillus senegalensis]
MLTFLIFISLLLHIVTFVAIRLLFQQMQRNSGNQDSGDSLRQTEELLSAYLQEIREENDRLLKEWDHATPKNEQDVQKEQKEEEGLGMVKPERVKPYEQEANSPSLNETAGESGYMPPLPQVQQDTVEKSMTAEVYSMYDQGYTIDEIAKKLDKGKTEVELMIKFHRKN